MARQYNPVVGFRLTDEDRTNAEAIVRALPRGSSAFSGPSFTDAMRAALRVAALAAAEGAFGELHAQAQTKTRR